MIRQRRRSIACQEGVVWWPDVHCRIEIGSKRGERADVVEVEMRE